MNKWMSYTILMTCFAKIWTYFSLHGKSLWISLWSCARQSSFFSKSSSCCWHDKYRSRICWLSWNQQHRQIHSKLPTRLQEQHHQKVRLSSVKHRPVSTHTLSLASERRLIRSLSCDVSPKDGRQPVGLGDDRGELTRPRRSLGWVSTALAISSRLAKGEPDDLTAGLI